MKRLLLATLAVITFVVTPAIAHDWSGVVTKLYQSVGMLTDFENDGFCSAFSINNRDDYALTAAHCVQSRYATQGALLDGAVTEVVFYDEDLDIAVLYVEGMGRPALKPRTKPIRVGMEVGAFGFALEDGILSHFRAGNVSSIGSIKDVEGLWVIADQAGIGGMSGGPVVDIDGKVVFVTQISDRSRHNAGRGIGEIYAATKKFWRN